MHTLELTENQLKILRDLTDDEIIKASRKIGELESIGNREARISHIETYLREVMAIWDVIHNELEEND